MEDGSVSTFLAKETVTQIFNLQSLLTANSSQTNINLV